MKEGNVKEGVKGEGGRVGGGKSVFPMCTPLVYFIRYIITQARQKVKTNKDCSIFSSSSNALNTYGVLLWLPGVLRRLGRLHIPHRGIRRHLRELGQILRFKIRAEYSLVSTVYKLGRLILSLPHIPPILSYYRRISHCRSA
jgi:hypothetical protein